MNHDNHLVWTQVQNIMYGEKLLDKATCDLWNCFIQFHEEGVLLDYACVVCVYMRCVYLSCSCM